MNPEQLATLRQLEAALRQSTHILERYPEQLYNQIVGRVDDASFLKVQNSASFAQPYLQLLSKTLRKSITRTLRGHSHNITSCAFSSDGNFLVSASEDATLRLWDMRSGKCLRTFQGHVKAVNACAFSPDDSMIVSASDDMTLRLWDRTSGASLQVFKGHGDVVNACTFSPDSTCILSTSGGNEMIQMNGVAENSLRLWNIETGQCKHIFEFPETLYNRICCCAISLDGRFALSGDADGRLCRWDLETRQCTRSVSEGGDAVLACTFVGINHYALSASADHKLRLWDMIDGKCLSTLDGHQDYVTGCIAFPNDREPGYWYAISSSHDYTLRLWDLYKNESLHILSEHAEWVNGCAYNRKKQLAASASSDHTIIIWDIGQFLTSPQQDDSVDASGVRESWQSERIFTGHDEGDRGCAFNPLDGRLIASTSGWKTLQMWDSTTSEPGQSFYYGKWLRSCAYSPDGRYVLGGYTDGALVLWDVETGREVKQFHEHQIDIWKCTFSQDGKYILSASSDETLKYWEIESGKCLHTLIGHRGLVEACAISPDGKLALSGARDWTLRLWNLDTSECEHVMEKEDGEQFRGMLEVNDCAFSPDGRYALSASDDRTLTLWDVATGTLIRTYDGHVKPVRGCAFSPDGRLIASVSEDQSVRLWNATTATCLCTFRGHTKIARSCAFSPDGKYILSEASDGTLRLWNVEQYRNISALNGHEKPVQACCFSPDGQYALTASKDRTLRLWSVADQEVVRIFSGHIGAVNDCAFSSDGKYALSASHDRTLRLWNVTNGTCEKKFSGHEEPVWGCAFSPDDRHILSGSGDRRVALWDIATGKAGKLYENSARTLERFSFTLDGRYIMSASLNRSLWLWNVERERQVPSYKNIVGPPLDREVQQSCTIFPAAYGRLIVNSTINPNGKTALSTYPEGTLLLWEIATGKEMRHYENPAGGLISNANFGRDGRFFLGITADHLLYVWDANKEKPIAFFPADAEILCAAFHPDGQRIIAGDSSGAVHFLKLVGVSLEHTEITVPLQFPEQEASIESVPLAGEKRAMRPPASAGSHEEMQGHKNKKERRLWSFFGLFKRRQSSDPMDAIPLRLRLNLTRWLEAFSIIAGARRYLENHLELLCDESEQFFTIMIAKAEREPDLAKKLRTILTLLRRIRADGDTRAAVRDAFIDEFGAFTALDLPPQLDLLRKRLDRGIIVSELIPLLHDALAETQDDGTVIPEIVASLQLMLAEFLQNSQEEHYGEVIELAANALNVFTLVRFPKQFVRAQSLRGSAYFLREMSEQHFPEIRKENAQHAIESFKAALGVLRPETQAEEWAQTQMKLGIAYDLKGVLRCATLHLTKALDVFTEENYPDQYQVIQKNLDKLANDLMERDLKLEKMKGLLDADMIQGIIGGIEAADKECADEQ